jgi:hypothetical protein
VTWQTGLNKILLLLPHFVNSCKKCISTFEFNLDITAH